MSTPAEGAPAPVVAPIPAPLAEPAGVPLSATVPASVAPATAPPETLIPEPPARSPFVVVKPLLGGDGVLASPGAIVSLTAAQAAEWAALLRPAQIIDLSRWGKPPIAL